VAVCSSTEEALKASSKESLTDLTCGTTPHQQDCLHSAQISIASVSPAFPQHHHNVVNVFGAHGLGKRKKPEGK
jgi:hypothetical protein